MITISTYNIVLRTEEATVVSEYIPDISYTATGYQTEHELEDEFIRTLIAQGYEYINIYGEDAFVGNLRTQLQIMNGYTFSDDEWQRFFGECIANANEGIAEKSRKIQEDYVQVLRRDDGSSQNIRLIDKQDIHNNRLQVINQYAETGGSRKVRYDVTILVNGFPLVHIELKRRGVPIREAFNQIDRYQRDSFWATHGLFQYVQIFVISNGTHTKYYSNTTRSSHITEQEESGRRQSKKTSNSFEFTSFWADANNKPIPDLIDFTKTFFAKHTLLNVLTKYCVFTSQRILLVMRPYQIVATERILSKIRISQNYKQAGTRNAGGYIWHTTGSGKTLTSFKTSLLASQMPGIDKVLFIVDRRDLDYQTMKEYDKFQEGAANGNTSTRELQRQLEDPLARIIITTIQKLDRFIALNKGHSVFKQHVVLIFDECHRSQFGAMHTAITRSFKQYYIFGFTGTPIFAVNAGKSGNPNLRTTEQAFGDKLHTYTIVDAINDGNVLPFRIDYIRTVKSKEGIEDKDVEGIDDEKALIAPERLQLVTSYILDHFDQKTMRNSSYRHQGRTLAGFNAMFAVASIPMAKAYYAEFKRQLEERNRHLKIAMIYTFNANEGIQDDFFDEDGFDTQHLDISSREFLEEAIGEYNRAFATNYDTSQDRFQNYYKDLSQRVKDREVDLLIVVNMFLTGFDATTLNTLWVDRNMRQHGLIQAFSRTNRILNTVKTFGNIVCFRNLREATDEAVALFGDKEAGGIVLLRRYEDYYFGYDNKGNHEKGYADLIAELLALYPMSQTLVGEQNKADFIRLYGQILKLKNILTAFDEFEGKEILSEREFQDYQSRYIDLYQERTRTSREKEDIVDDIIFEIELIRQIEVNIDYILSLVEKYHASHCADKTILEDVGKAIDASIQLRSKKELIEGFIARVNNDTDVQTDWRAYVSECRDAELQAIITEERLKEDLARTFISNAFRDGEMRTYGTDVDRILPAMSRFGQASNRAERKQDIIDKLQRFFEKYFGLV